ncbi:SNF2 family DNA or RNA helicase [Methanofollis sp. W23]|uniref:DEAD/DEAH box helicase n=1 Tax=Methanofollis sp. W23 TaxID=2817849 RepID=UPI001AE2E6A8|nr:helicase-related protein [Methanofollis sp. W23]MBP2145412.1 SNF2 family DNA or RNA helicase [Methanofollis sp. W23]
MDLVQTGRWLWSTEYAEPVQVIDTQQIWGTTTCRFWVPSANTVAVGDAASCTSLDQAPPLEKDEVIARAAAGRIIDHLAGTPLLAPLFSPVTPLPHQVAALAQACARDPVRCLFADEVGLGKTIEAGLVIKELKLRNKAARVLIVAPRGLVTQWVAEMQTHFSETFTLVDPAGTDPSLWHQIDHAIVSIDAIKPLRQRRGWTPARIHQYNQDRFHAVTQAGWDLIIVDEAHKLAGTNRQVARHTLGRGLARSARHLLLLSATPHQGKTDAFLRLMSLLDPTTFQENGQISRDDLRPYIIRTEKRTAIGTDGAPLFRPRQTKIVEVEWDEAHRLQADLYDGVTAYVRTGYNRALTEKRNYIGFLMVLMQRLVSSSTRSIRTTLEKRLAVLEGSAPRRPPTTLNDWWDMETDEQIDEAVQAEQSSHQAETEQVRLLLDLARRCEATRPDAKAERLVDLMYSRRGEENNPNLKFLIFTEFVPTQQMLTDYLTTRGFSVVCLNGSMDMDERRRAQQTFATTAQVMISTEAGGEGLNLQFCHIAINYDLPWNPMRIEQRIGRVDRIGQTHDVMVYNMVFSGTVEQRVHEVLLEKLLVILNDLGFDKFSDVLDSSEAERGFEDLFIHAILDPDHTDHYLDTFIAAVQEQAREEKQTLSSLLDHPVLSVGDIQDYLHSPLPALTEHLVTSAFMARGGEITRGLQGFDLTWPDGHRQTGIVFDPPGNDPDLNLLTVADPAVSALLTSTPYASPDQPIPTIHIPDLPEEVRGLWSLWKLSVSGTPTTSLFAIPSFIDDTGHSFPIAARQIWDTIARGAFSITGATTADPALYDQSRDGAAETSQGTQTRQNGTPAIYPVLFLHMEGGRP